MNHLPFNIISLPPIDKRELRPLLQGTTGNVEKILHGQKVSQNELQVFRESKKHQEISRTIFDPSIPRSPFFVPADIGWEPIRSENFIPAFHKPLRRYVFGM